MVVIIVLTALVFCFVLFAFYMKADIKQTLSHYRKSNNVFLQEKIDTDKIRNIENELAYLYRGVTLLIILVLVILVFMFVFV